MRIAIIPARGGSKRIPRKNVRVFRGKPIIAWSIEAALESLCFDQVVVTTDDEDIARVARDHGASVPFMRPAHLADDYTATLPVLRHALAAMENQSKVKIEAACCIYATAPFVTPAILREGMDILLADQELDFAFSVSSYPFPIQRAMSITDEHRVKMVQPEHELTRSQDLPERYHDAGQFYWFRRQGLLNNDGVFSACSAPVIVSRERVQDIDSLEDWRCAELAHQLLEKRQS